MKFTILFFLSIIICFSLLMICEKIGKKHVNVTNKLKLSREEELAIASYFNVFSELQDLLQKRSDTKANTIKLAVPLDEETNKRLQFFSHTELNNYFKFLLKRLQEKPCYLMKETPKEGVFEKIFYNIEDIKPRVFKSNKMVFACDFYSANVILKKCK